MSKKETAEQKLLKIIESQGGASASTLAAPNAAPAPKVSPAQQVASDVRGLGMPSFSFQSFLKNFEEIFSKFSLGKQPSIAFGLREVNFLFMAALALVGVVLVMNIVSGMRLLKYRFTPLTDLRVLDSSENYVPPVEEIAKYIESFKRRNIFKPFEKKVEVAHEEAPVTQVTLLESKLKDLKLVGISWLDSAESASAMIEDTTSGITYFLSTGEKIRDIVVKTIYADSVMVAFQGQEVMLHL